MLSSCDDALSRRAADPARVESRRAPSSAAAPARSEGEPNPYAGCLRPGRRCDVADVNCQRELFDTVQCLYGATDALRPAVRFISTDLLEKELRANDDRLAREQAALEYAARRMGLSQEPANTPPSDSTRPNAYYAAEKDTIFIAEREAIPSDGELAWLILAHEYVHTLQNRKGELRQALRSRHERSFDQELALFAGFEGEAMLYEQILRALHHGQRPRRWALERFEGETGWSDDAVLGQSRLLESSFGTFPYSYGAYWAARRWLDAPEARLDRRSIPQTTYEFLARRHGWDLEQTALPWPACLRRSVPGDVRVKEQALGAWLIQAFVRKQTHDANQARSIASDLRGDSLSVYAEDRAADFSFVWRSAWASPSAARTMSRLLEAQLRASAQEGDEVSVRVQNGALVAVALSQRPRQRSADQIAALELATCTPAPAP